MAVEIIMPKAGMAMEEGTIIQWMKSVGDRIETGEVILEIETDKTAMEVEAETSGCLIGIIHDAGATVPVTQPIGWIGAEGEKPPAAASEAVPAMPSGAARADSASVNATAKDVAFAVSDGPRPKATPAARRRAADLGIGLADASGTGPAGEIIAADIEALAGGASRISPLAAHAAGKTGVDPALITGSGHGGRILTRGIAEQGAIQRNLARIQGKIEPFATPVWRSDDDVVAKASGIRMATARKMLESHHTSPPVTLNFEVNADRLISLRTEINELREKNGEEKFSLNVFFLRAVALSTRRCPWMRCSLSGDAVIEHAHVNLGMAVASSTGLMVPVIADADQLSLTRLSEVTADLASRARARKLSLDEMSGATFTVTNLGMYGITHFTPIVNPPESAILGIGTTKKELCLGEGGTVREESVLCLSLTIDHRIIDGAQGAVFAQQLTGLLEEPLQFLL